ncbi:MAG: hypothetical protein IKD50_13685, partial [Clostridia bacterium]|nr:hypothetical protein [Clostridia bacterium]
RAPSTRPIRILTIREVPFQILPIAFMEKTPFSFSTGEAVMREKVFPIFPGQISVWTVSYHDGEHLSTESF